MQNVSRFDKVDKFEHAVSVSGWDVFSQLGFCAAFEHTGTWSHSAAVEIISHTQYQILHQACSIT